MKFLYRTSFSETYVIIFGDEGLINQYTSSNNGTLTYTTLNNVNCIKASSNCKWSPNISLNGNFILEFDYYPTDYWEWEIINFNDIKICNLSSSYDVSGAPVNVANLGYNQWISVKITREGNIISLYINGSLKGEKTLVINDPITITFWGNRLTYYKNFKLEQL